MKKDSNPLTIPLCEKSKDVIEPLIKPQWWWTMADMAASAVAAVETGQIQIRPETAERSFFRWLRAPQDWSLSRQHWWGHQILAYRIELLDADVPEESRWVAGRTREEAEANADDFLEESRWVAGRTREEAEAKAAERFPGSPRLNRDRSGRITASFFVLCGHPFRYSIGHLFKHGTHSFVFDSQSR